MRGVNIHYKRIAISQNIADYANHIHSTGGIQLIDKPTHISKTCESIIDRILTNLVLINQVTLTIIYKDISAEFRTKMPKTLNCPPKVGRLTLAKIDIFLEDLSNSLNCRFVANDTVITLLSNLTNPQFPKKMLSRKQYKTAQNPWITMEVLATITRKNKLCLKTKCP